MNPMMDDLYRWIVRLRAENAQHLKSGKRLQDLTDEDVCKHLATEVVELAIALEKLKEANSTVDRMDQEEAVAGELADCLILVLHQAVRSGFSLNGLVSASFDKLALRFK